MGMQDADLDKFEKALKLLAKRFRKRIDDDEIMHYFVHLSKYHVDTVCWVIDYWTHNNAHKKFPTEGELIKSIRTQSSQAYIEEKKIDHEREIRLKELENEYTLVCKQICANQSNSKFMSHPIMRKLMAKNSEVVKKLNRDYSAYKTELTNVQLYNKLNEIRRKLSNLVI